MKQFKAGDRIVIEISTEVIRPQLYGYELANGLTIPYKALEQNGVTVRKTKKPRPEVGTVIDGQTLADTWWKAGTLIREEDCFYVLGSDGWWYVNADRVHGGGFSFENFQHALNLTVVYLP